MQPPPRKGTNVTKDTPSDLARKVPPLSALPKCESCKRPFMPALPLVPTCFRCALAAKRREARP